MKRQSHDFLQWYYVIEHGEIYYYYLGVFLDRINFEENLLVILMLGLFLQSF